ncbi:MAG: hypothetical protein ACO1NO_01560 [Burkholderiaceae bacterium]
MSAVHDQFAGTEACIEAAPGLQRIISSKPSYPRMLKHSKSSIRQGFVARYFPYPMPEQEAYIVQHKGNADYASAQALVSLPQRLHSLQYRDLPEVPRICLLTAAKRMMSCDIPVKEICLAFTGQA